MLRTRPRRRGPRAIGRRPHHSPEDRTPARLDVDSSRTSVFIYIDPPYQLVRATSNFVSNKSNGFGWNEHERLADWVARVIDRGCYVLVNNADTPEVRQLYQSAFKSRQIKIQQSFTTARNINSHMNSRSGSLELAIWNH